MNKKYRMQSNIEYANIQFCISFMNLLNQKKKILNNNRAIQKFRR